MKKTTLLSIAAMALGLLLIGPSAKADNWCVMLTFECPSQGDFVGYAVANLSTHDDAFLWWPENGPDPFLCLETDKQLVNTSCVDVVIDDCWRDEADVCGWHPFDFHRSFSDLCEFKNTVHWKAWDNSEYMAAYDALACE